MRILLIITIVTIIFSSGCNNPPDFQQTYNQILVYPNPTIASFNVTIPNSTNLPYRLQVFGIKGDMIFDVEDNQTNPRYEIDIYNKPKGIYQVVLIKGGVKTVQQVIKI